MAIDAERILVTAIGGAKGAAATAMDAATAAAGDDGPAVLIEITGAKPKPATLLAPRGTKRIESDLRVVDREARIRARGRICVATVEDGEMAVERVEALLDAIPGGVPCVMLVPASRYRELLESSGSVYLG